MNLRPVVVAIGLALRSCAPVVCERRDRWEQNERVRRAMLRTRPSR